MMLQYIMMIFILMVIYDDDGEHKCKHQSLLSDLLMSRWRLFPNVDFAKGAVDVVNIVAHIILQFTILDREKVNKVWSSNWIKF